MKILIRQNWWFRVFRIATGCATIGLGVVVAYEAVVAAHGQSLGHRFVLIGMMSMTLIPIGAYYALYSLREWNPRGFVAGVNRNGLVLKVNGARPPRLIAIRWKVVRGCTFKPFPWWLSFLPNLILIELGDQDLVTRFPWSGGGVLRRELDTICLYGYWDDWQPRDVAELIDRAAKDEEFRKTL